MANYAPLTAGLRHVPPLADLNPGDAFIIRYKNSVRNYKTDLWIAIMLPDNFKAASGLHRPPNGAKPASGEWTVDADKRVYPVYLPGRNLCRWIPIADFFVLGNKVPRIFVHNVNGQDYTSDAKIYWELVKIIERKPGIDFWQSMAKKESLVKGKRGKSLGLVLPDGFDVMVQGITTEDSSTHTDDQPDAAELEGEPPKKVQAVTNSFSVSKTLDNSSDQNVDRPSSLTFPILPVGRAESARGSGLEQNQSTSNTIRAEVLEQDVQPPKKEEEPIESINNSLVDQQNSLFERTWTLAAMIEHVLLEKDSRELRAIFRAVSTVQEPEAGKLISFLKTQEFDPQLLKISLARQISSHEAEEFEIGDCLGIHRQFQLHGVTNSTDLQEQIARLGRLYSYARRLNMVDLVEKITFKLQAAWNSYPGLSQLEPLLDMTAVVFKNATCTDHLQDWLIKFIADTQDLIYYHCPHRYWALMKDLPDLYNSITRMRSEVSRKNQERYANPRDQIRERGIDDF